MSIRAADEKTELLLLDYLDGALPPERRIELETYLRAHPKEQQILEDLKVHRRQLGAVPAEPAPREVYEVAQSQLERAALLDHFTEDRQEVSGRRSSPQWISLAAVLVLGTGLAAALYFVLAPDGKPHDLGVTSPFARNDGRVDESAKVSAGAATRPVVLEGADSKTGDALASVAPAPPGGADGALPEAAAPDRSRAAGRLDREVASPAALAMPSVGLAAAEAPVRLLTIATADPLLSRARVESVLRSGGWAFMVAPAESVGAAVGASQGANFGDQQLPPPNNYGQAPESLNDGTLNNAPNPARRSDEAWSVATRPTPAPTPAPTTFPTTSPFGGVSASSPPSNASTTSPANDPPSPLPAPAGVNKSELTPPVVSGSAAQSTEVLVVRVESDQLDALVAALNQIGRTQVQTSPDLPSSGADPGATGRKSPEFPAPRDLQSPAPETLKQAIPAIGPARIVRLVVRFETLAQSKVAGTEGIAPTTQVMNPAPASNPATAPATQPAIAPATQPATPGSN